MARSSCFSVENGSLALGVISSVASCLIILAITILEAYNGYLEIVKGDYSYFYQFKVFNSRAFYMYFAISAINLLFSVLLCNGVVKRKASQVMAYYVYSFILMIPNTFIIVFLIRNEYGYVIEDTVLSWIVTAAVAVYVLIHCLVLAVVYATYKKLKGEGGHQFKHRMLIES